MNRYLPTGNEMVSLPKINESTGGIEDFTYLSMAHKGLIEVRGGENTPLIVPFLQIGGEEILLTAKTWNREHYWIPALSAKAGSHDFSLTVLTPVGERGFAPRLSPTRSARGPGGAGGRQGAAVGEPGRSESSPCAPLRVTKRRV